MGNNWTPSFDIRVTQSGSDMIVRDGAGRAGRISCKATARSSRSRLFPAQNVRGKAFTLEFADKGRWVFNPLNGSPSAGKIAQSIDRNSNPIQFSYDGSGRLAGIVDTLGRSYQVAYDRTGGLARCLISADARSCIPATRTGNPLGANGMFRTIRSPLVTGTPTGNDFLAGKTQTCSIPSARRIRR